MLSVKFLIKLNKHLKITMSKKNPNIGGARPGAGRKPRDEEKKLIEILDRHIDPDLVCQVLLKKVLEGDQRALSLYLAYRFGKPTETINQNTNITSSDIDIRDLISFKSKNDKE